MCNDDAHNEATRRRRRRRRIKRRITRRQRANVDDIHRRPLTSAHSGQSKPFSSAKARCACSRKQINFFFFLFLSLLFLLSSLTCAIASGWNRSFVIKFSFATCSICVARRQRVGRRGSRAASIYLGQAKRRQRRPRRCCRKRKVLVSDFLLAFFFRKKAKTRRFRCRRQYRIRLVIGHCA